MFGRKKEPEVGKSKVKQLHPRQIVENRITEEVEKLAPGETLIYKLPELFWSGYAAFLIVELNPSYPEKGKKYLLSTDKIVDGKPAGQKSNAGDSNKARDAAEWIAAREIAGGSVTRFQ